MEELSLSQATKLLAAIQPKHRASWATPHRAILREAVEHNESFVTLDGERFKLSITTDKFLLTPVRGFTPMGWFLKQWLYQNEEESL